MILDKPVPAQLDAILNVVRREGQATPCGNGWEHQGVKVLIADGGYSVLVVTVHLSVWGEHGSGRSGFFYGDKALLDELLAELSLV